MPQTVTKEQMVQGFMLMKTVCETVREAGEIPSGTMYNALLNVCTLPAYESMISQLVRTGLISCNGHLLKWTGPSI